MNWEQVGTDRALAPDTEYDGEGVFTGCFVPTGLNGEEDQLSLIYTSVTELPIHWTLPHSRGSEGISAATSSDGGKTWDKVDEVNPILREEPEDLNVTAWRDPYIKEWPTMDRLLGKSSLYGVVSGGIKEVGPTAFLYSMPADDLTAWEYLGPLLDIPEHFQFSEKWSNDMGTNLECANLMTLGSHCGPSFEFLVGGSEGGVEKEWVTEYLSDKDENHPRRTIRSCNWLSGALEKTQDGGVVLGPTFGGIFDHGSLYAINSFEDPVSGRQIAWGWIPEEDLPLDYHREKGWNGALSLPRELSLQTIKNVKRALASELGEISSMYLDPGRVPGTFTAYTLGIRPAAEVSTQHFFEAQTWNDVSLPESDDTETVKSLGFAKGETFRVKATIAVDDSCTELGLHLRHNSDISTGTTISFRPADELIIVDRSKSTSDSDINTAEERGPFTLFTLDDGQGEEREKLELEVFWDGDVLEVFANGRFALTTMVYTGDKEALGVSLFAEGGEGCAVFEDVEMSDV